MKRYEMFSADDIIDLITDGEQGASKWCKPDRIADKYKDDDGYCTCDCVLCMKAWLVEEMDDDKTESGLLTDE